MSSRIRANAARGLLCLLLASPAAEAIEFLHDLQQVPEDNDKPVVLVFEAGWCSWCRKMEIETLRSDEVEAAAPRFVWVKIDIDQAPEDAARFAVEGLPTVILLDPQGRVLGANTGFLTSEALLDFLESSLSNPHPSPTPLRSWRMPSLRRRGKPSEPSWTGSSRPWPGPRRGDDAG